MKILDEGQEKIVFVILHYLAIDETYRSIEYIRENIDTSNYKIIVVDNASGNGSGKELENSYKEAEDVIVILNPENLGFARGNNVGFLYAKEKLNPDFIVLMNNDVYLLEKNFHEKLEKEYKKSQYAVLGPLILTRDGKCNANPARMMPLSKMEVEKRIRVLRRFLKLQKIHMLPLYMWAAEMMHTVLDRKKQKSNGENEKDFITKRENVQLHGCFMVFSKEYIDRFEGLDNRTFLYMEEDILYQHILNNQLKTVYFPDIVVFHKEDVATDLQYISKKTKSRMQYENELRSCQILLQVQQGYSRE